MGAVDVSPKETPVHLLQVKLLFSFLSLSLFMYVCKFGCDSAVGYVQTYCKAAQHILQCFVQRKKERKKEMKETAVQEPLGKNAGWTGQHVEIVPLAFSLLLLPADDTD